MCFIMDYQSLSSLLFLCVLFCCFSRINFSFQNFLQNENIRLVGATTKAQDDGISAILKIFLSLQKIFIAAMEVGSVNERERAREGGVVVIGQRKRERRRRLKRKQIDQVMVLFLLKKKKLNNLFIKGIYVILDVINLCIHNFLFFIFKNLRLNLTEYVKSGIICTFSIQNRKITRFNT